MHSPFYLSTNVIWLIQTLSTPIITVLGWLVIFNINRRNMKAEKRLIIKLQAYDNIKDILNSTIEAYANLGGFMVTNRSYLERSVKSNVDYDYLKQALINELEERKFRLLYDNANNHFNKLIYQWEQYEIVFKPLVLQRYAIHEEWDESINVVGNVITDYYSYVMSIKSGLGQEEDRETLVAKMEVGYDWSNTIMGCVHDIRNNLQTYVYGNILRSKNEPRRVADTKKYLTIDTLMKKHEVTLEYLMNLNKPKSLTHRMWKRFLDFKNKTG